MKPKVVSIKKQKQGSSDADSSWAQARYAWTRQLLARLGELERTSKHGPIEKKYDGALQGKLSLDQIVWWDETHQKCLIGMQNPSKAFYILFPRNKQGRIDVDNGENSKERKFVLNVKYEKECRLGLGVTMVTPLGPDSTPLSSEGRRCHPFDYSSRVMISMDDYQRLLKFEFQRIKSLKDQNGYWIKSIHDSNIPYYNDDPLSKLKGVGKKTSQLLQEIGVNTIGELKKTEVSQVENLPEKLTPKRLTQYYNEAQKASDKNAPKMIDHRVASSLYKSKFGDDWEKHLKASPTFSHSVCICDYIDHLMSESEKVMRGTIHENTWMVCRRASIPRTK